MLFNPLGTHVKVGDFVEFRMGGFASQQHGTALNTVTRVLQTANQQDGECWWDPKPKGNYNLWMRTTFCNWMPDQGWMKQGRTNPAWYKPAPAQ
jgi:hypothetical protein